ncbi:uncharacterized protein LOC130801045 [Amaranthus tricolor]|uniref:uncharacterized protein LOC130801045 n=1 Tax=Amaranthus tricolor TaxID=29722 RepID=UPI00258B1A7C|nr:uncharacterized protein LOC130801045 [Amaranthus tricolor]
MNEIKEISVDAYTYLAAILACHWTRHAFPTRCKSGMLSNNCCESFNNVLRETRGKSIISLIEWIRRYVMQRCAAKREGLNQIKGVLMPSVMKFVENQAQNVHSMRDIAVNVMEFKVDEGMHCVVKRKLDFAPYVHEAYYVSTYAKTYAPTFHGMPGHRHWPTSQLDKPLPPPFRNMPGRPTKNKRKSEFDEGRDGKKKKNFVERDFKQNKCGNCGGLDHYKKTCKNPPKSNEASTSAAPVKRGRPKKHPSITPPTTSLPLQQLKPQPKPLN